MANNFAHEAAIPNLALKPFDILIGEWKTIGTHPYLPNTTLHGHTSFKWIEGGAFLIMHSEIDEEGVFPVALQFSVVTMLPQNILCFTLMSVMFQENMRFHL